MPPLRSGHPRRRGGLTLIEVLVALTVISIVLAMSAPSAMRTMEQAHADLAGANLRAIANAQRYYWLENRSYAASLSTLDAEGLLDSSLVTATGRYAYSISSATADEFVAVATRTGSSVWSGQFTTNEADTLGGSVAYGTYTITPGFH